MSVTAVSEVTGYADDMDLLITVVAILAIIALLLFILGRR